MSVFLNIFLFILFGLFSGILGGLGMGGGTLLIPLLTIFMGLDQKLSQGINLLSFLIMSIFSLIIHYKRGFIKTEDIFLIIFNGIIFSVLGALLAGYLPSNILRVIFGAFLCFLSVFQLVKVFWKSKKTNWVI